MNGVTIAYSGVHQAFQIALAAAEMGRLDEFCCSFFAAPGKWGGWFERLLGEERLVNRKATGIPLEKVVEYPWAYLGLLLRRKLASTPRFDWAAANEQFDRWAAKRIQCSTSRIFVGVETCALESMRVARSRGMVTFLDSTQVHPVFLRSLLDRAGEQLGIRRTIEIDAPRTTDRKQEEFALADHILIYSEIQRRSFAEAGFDEARLVEIPLWADGELWDIPRECRNRDEESLEVLFVGSIGLRKGIPWLLRATQQVQRPIRLRLVGRIEETFRGWLQDQPSVFEHVPPQPRRALRRYYAEADVLVLPSLVDSFGFVAMEAMLAGVPVIVSENCGVPVPDRTWRVPVMDGDAIAARLEYYAENRAALERDRARAKEFARQFTPGRYRNQIKSALATILERFHSHAN